MISSRYSPKSSNSFLLRSNFLDALQEPSPYVLGVVELRVVTKLIPHHISHRYNQRRKYPLTYTHSFKNQPLANEICQGYPMSPQSDGINLPFSKLYAAYVWRMKDTKVQVPNKRVLRSVTWVWSWTGVCSTHFVRWSVASYAVEEGCLWLDELDCSFCWVQVIYG